MSLIINKEDIAKYGLVKSKQKEGAKVNINGKEYEILHICKDKDYRVIIEKN